MDLLFRNNMFEEVIEVYTTFRNKQMVFGKHPKSAMVLVFGAYYKLVSTSIPINSICEFENIL